MTHSLLDTVTHCLMHICCVCMCTCLFLDPIQKGWTALYIACKKGHDELVKILLQAGADPNIQNEVSILK